VCESGRGASCFPLRRLSVTSASHVPSPKRASSHGVGVPPRVFKNSSDSAPIGLARSPFVVCPVPALGHAATDPTLGFLRHRPFLPALTARRKSSHRLWLPFRVSPTHTAKPALEPWFQRQENKQPRLAPPEVSFPFSVLPAMGSYLTPTRTQLAGYVASSGFLALSTLCSPHDLPGLFHPGSAHGICPSRSCSSRAAPYALSSAATLMRLALFS